MNERILGVVIFLQNRRLGNVLCALAFAMTFIPASNLTLRFMLWFMEDVIMIDELSNYVPLVYSCGALTLIWLAWVIDSLYQKWLYCVLGSIGEWALSRIYDRK